MAQEDQKEAKETMTSEEAIGLLNDLSTMDYHVSEIRPKLTEIADVLANSGKLEQDIEALKEKFNTKAKEYKDEIANLKKEKEELHKEIKTKDVLISDLKNMVNKLEIPKEEIKPVKEEKK